MGLQIAPVCLLIHLEERSLDCLTFPVTKSSSITTLALCALNSITPFPVLTDEPSSLNHDTSGRDLVIDIPFAPLEGDGRDGLSPKLFSFFTPENGSLHVI